MAKVKLSVKIVNNIILTKVLAKCITQAHCYSHNVLINYLTVLLK